MSKTIFTEEQIEQLSSNANVSRCGERSITYGKNFKLNAVQLYQQGLTSTEIFRQAGFDLNVIGRGKPKECLKRWNRTCRIKGEAVLATETRGKGGGRPRKIQDKSDADKIKRLEAEVAYLKAENDFLTKLRAKRAE